MISGTSSSSFLGLGTVAVVVGDESLGERLIAPIVSDGFELRQLNTGRELLDLVRNEWVDAIVIIGDMPDIDSTSICRLIRHEPEAGRVPILVIGDFETSINVRTLRAGADDCMPGDTEPRILIARIKSILRRCGWAEAEKDVDFDRQDKVIRIGEILIRPARYSVHVAGEPLDLTASEFRILTLLASRPHHVFSRDQVFQAIHRSMSDANDRSIDSHVYSLRKKLGVASNYIETVRGVGYRIINANSHE